MSLTRQLARRAPLAATLGLVACLGLLPATASAVATYAADVDWDPFLDTTEGWLISSISQSPVRTTPTNSGNTNVILDLPSAQSGEADTPGGELERSVLNTITITVTNSSGLSSANTLLVEFELIADAITTLIDEEARATAAITLAALAPVSLTSSVLAAESPFTKLADLPGTLELDINVLVGESQTFTLLVEAGGHAVSPSITPEPTTLSLLGLGLLAAGYARRRRRS